MQDRHRHSQRAAAARAGFSERTARRIDADPRVPSQRQPERGRTVPDPLEVVWEPVLLPILERDPAVQAVTLLRHLQMADPDAFPDDRVRRTLERRVRDWRALHGAARDVIFRQTSEPGRMALSDFTDATELGVTIAGAPFPHRLFHFVLACSGWEHVAVVLGGESYTALAENLQNALWTLGGVPREHRTDSLSASTTTGSRPSSAPPRSSSIRGCAAAAMASASTASTTAISSTPCAASRFAGGEPPVRSLAGPVYREGLFPRTEYAAAWRDLSAALPRRDACRRMVDLLWLAHDEACEAELAALIAEDLATGRLPEAKALRKRLEPRRRSLPADIPVALTELASFDALLEVRA